MNHMLDLLRRLNPATLVRTVGQNILSRVEGLVDSSGSGSQFDVATYVLALYGTDLLNERSIRRLLFQLIDDEVLKDLALRHGGRSLEKSYDNALILAICPWRSGNRLVYDVARHLRLPKDYLPVSARRSATVERIEPTTELHPLHDYQQEVKDVIKGELRKGVGALLIQMPTGAGKTRTAMQALVEHACETRAFSRETSILWLAHTEELCEQAIETFQKVWRARGDSVVHIVRLWGNHSPNVFDLYGSFLVGTFQKLAAIQDSENPIFAAIRHDSRVIVTDEAHKVLAPTFRMAVDALRGEGCTLIGLTATPGRGATANEENIALAKLFDRNLISPDLGDKPILALQNMGVLSRLVRKPIRSTLDIHLSASERNDLEQGSDVCDGVLCRIASDKGRNRAILAEIERQVQADNPCIVFSCGIEHSRILAAALTLRGISAAHVDGSMSKGLRSTAIEGFRTGVYDVLLNYGVLATGFDAPRIRTVVITRPTTSLVLYSQMLGRGLRGPRMGGAAECILVDIKDNFLNFGDIDAVYTYFADYWSSVAAG